MRKPYKVIEIEKAERSEANTNPTRNGVLI
jgi:hypothetical protein